MIQIDIEATADKYLPKKAHADDAAYDIAACVASGVFTIAPGETRMIDAGFFLGLQPGYEALVTPRSSMGKRGILIPNSPGIVDAGYRGEVKVLLHNTTDKPFDVYDGDRIAQIRFKEVLQTELNLTKVQDDTERGSGGFGSTGK